MEPVIRALAMYALLMVVLRLSGRRTLSEMSVSDFVLLLVISEAAQQALVGEDFSFTTGVIVIVTLVLADIAISLVRRRWPWFDKVTAGVPMVLVHDGRVLGDRLRRARVDLGDVLVAARQQRGLERLDQIHLAVLEASGHISVIARQGQD